MQRVYLLYVSIKQTKAIQFLMSDTKVYRATLSLGKSTDTYDASGKVLEEKEVGEISKEQVEGILNSFFRTFKTKSRQFIQQLK